jgi:uncharacterized protein
MPVIETNFPVNAFLNNGHLQTIYPYLFRKIPQVELSRKRINLNDGDFLDVDHLHQGSDELVVLSHGLEGSSNTGYIRGMAKHLGESHHYDVIAWNMRSCSGEINRKDYFYHGASCGDLNAVLEFALQEHLYKKIHLIGFSLGGNLTAFYASKYGNQKVSQVYSATVFSSPIHLESSIHKLHSTQICNIYSENFLVTMRKKALEKHKLGLINIDPEQIKNCKKFYEFDDLITAPLHGFKNAKEYYNEASAINLIHQTKIPTLIVQSKDDPFLTKKCYPLRQAKKNQNLFLEITPTGGHIGFMYYNKGISFWAEKRAVEFLKKIA